MSDTAPVTSTPTSAPAPSSTPAPEAISSTPEVSTPEVETTESVDSSPDSPEVPAWEVDPNDPTGTESLDNRIRLALQKDEKKQRESIETSDEPEETEATPVPILSEEDKLAQELGIDPKRNNKIPYSKVKRIIANKEKALTE